MWRGLEGVAGRVQGAGGRGTRYGGGWRAWHGVWIGLEGVDRTQGLARELLSFTSVNWTTRV